MTESNWLFSVMQVSSALPGEAAAMNFTYALRHGTMKLGLYAPIGVDPQEPHKQDELYFVVSGSGDFELAGECRPVKSGDAIFVSAGEHHRFVDFTDDFAAWVVFWGVEGGER